MELDEYATSSLFNETERLVLRLADAMTTTPARIDDTLFAELRVKFDETQLAEIASALAWENYRARFNRVFDVESEDYSHGAFCPMPVRSDPSR